MNEIEEYLEAVALVAALQKLKADWAATTKRTVSVNLMATVHLEGIEIKGAAVAALQRGMADKAKRGIPAQLDDAIVAAQASAAALKAAAKAKYDSLFA